MAMLKMQKRMLLSHWLLSTADRWMDGDGSQQSPPAEWLGD